MTFGLTGKGIAGNVESLVGKDKKKEGEVIEIDRSNNRAKIKGLNLIKRHMKATKEKKGSVFLYVLAIPGVYMGIRLQLKEI